MIFSEKQRLPFRIMPLVQRVAAALDETVMRGRRIEFCDLGFEMFVDKQQRPQRATQVAVATCHDFVDRSFTRSETHSKTPSHCPFGITLRPIRCFT